MGPSDEEQTMSGVTADLRRSSLLSTEDIFEHSLAESRGILERACKNVVQRTKPNCQPVDACKYVAHSACTMGLSSASDSDTPSSTRSSFCESQKRRSILKKNDGSSSSIHRKGIVFHPSVLLWNSAVEGKFDDLQELLQTIVRGDSQGMKADNLEATRSNHNGVTILHLCCFAGAVDCVRLLLRVGAFSNAVDKDGWTPAHAAAVRGNLQLIRLLHQAGADFDMRDSYGRTPSDVAPNWITKEELEILMSSSSKSTAV